MGKNHGGLGMAIITQDVMGFALATAIDKNDIERMKSILSAGGVIDSPSTGLAGNRVPPPLHLAIQGGFEETVEFLLESGAKADLPDLGGASPLHCAASRNRLDIAKILIGRGAQIDSMDNRGWRPLHTAAVAGFNELVRLLLDSGAAVDSQETDEGRTALHLAAFHGRCQVVQTLLENGASLMLRDKEGLTPFDVARPENIPMLEAWTERSHLMASAFTGDREEEGLASPRAL